MVMRFELADGCHTEVLFWKDREVINPFPSENVELVRKSGTEEAKELLERVIKEGFESVGDRLYIAFMGPPIPPYAIRCYCGHLIIMGHDEKGFYVEGANEMIFGPTVKSIVKQK